MRFGLIVTSLLFSTISFAADSALDNKTIKDRIAAIEATETKCLDTADSNNAMKQCAFSKHDEADALLNQVYKQIVTSLKAGAEQEKDLSDFEKLSQETLNRLVASERAWITYRDTQCNYEGANMLNGSGEGLIIGGCLGSKTIGRIKEIMPISAEN